jgi:predicted CoA-binding protein
MHSKFQKKQKKVSMFVESENSIQAATFWFQPNIHNKVLTQYTNKYLVILNIQTNTW